MVAVAFLKVVELGEFVSGLSNLALATQAGPLSQIPHARSVAGHHWAIAVAHGAKRCYESQRQVRGTAEASATHDKAGHAKLQCKRRPCQSDRFATVALSPSQSGEDLAEFSRSHRPFGALRGPGNGGRRRRSASTILEAPCSLQRQQMHTSNHNHKHSTIHIHRHIRLRLRLCL